MSCRHLRVCITPHTLSATQQPAHPARVQGEGFEFWVLGFGFFISFLFTQPQTLNPPCQTLYSAVPWAQVEVCCFDKTGTLTSDHLLLEGVAGVPKRAEEEIMPGELPPAVAQVLATCHALVQVGMPGGGQ